MRVRFRARLRIGCLTLAIVGLWTPLVVSNGTQLGLIEPAATFLGRNVAYWSGCLNSRDRVLRRETLSQLVEGGGDAVPVLASLLSSVHATVREQSAAALSRIGRPVIPAVIARLKDTDPEARLQAVTVLRSLGSDARDAALHVARLLRDSDSTVSMEAGRTLAMMGEHAAPAMKHLIRALSSRFPLTRVMAAGALASIGPRAAPATKTLIRALDDKDAGVRRCAADALAAIGPSAAAAVGRLKKALKDPDGYVRICAAGALGRMGNAAQSALAALRKARQIPFLEPEATWAIEQITGETPSAISRPTPTTLAEPLHAPQTPRTAVRVQKSTGDWPMLAGSPSRNNVSTESVPTSWHLEKRRNMHWSARLGNVTYGAPVIADGRVFVGTSNERPRIRRVKGKRGILMAFRESDGEFLWQDPTPLRKNSAQRLLMDVTSSSPLVEGERLYYINGQAQLVCLDTLGFEDGENDGPFTDEKIVSRKESDRIWELDLCAQFGVFPHETPNCSVAAAGDLLMVCTSNGVDEAHTNIPAPRAPSFVGVHKATGEVAWQVVGPSPRVLHGQWSSPAVAEITGRTIALFGGGDGWLYALEANSGREVWRFNGNRSNAVWRISGDIDGLTMRNSIIACPVVHDGVVYLAMGQDPTHGTGKGVLFAIDPRGHGDVTGHRTIWKNTAIGRMIATPVVRDHLIFAADTNGFVHCIDADNGRTIWTDDLLAGVWGGLILAGNHLYVGDEDGQIHVFEADRDKHRKASMKMDSAIWGVPAAANGVLYFVSARRLHAIGR